MGQPGFVLESDRVTIAVTELGGHLAPARFRIGRRVIEPLSVAPWWDEKHAGQPAILRVLRGEVQLQRGEPHDLQLHPALGAADDLANEAEEAGRTARDIEARRRKERDRGLGFDDGMDAEAIENYYRFDYLINQHIRWSL